MSENPEIYFEFTTIGNATKVTAIDPQSKIEVSIVTPTGLDIEQMKIQALKKLQYKLSKNQF